MTTAITALVIVAIPTINVHSHVQFRPASCRRLPVPATSSATSPSAAVATIATSTTPAVVSLMPSSFLPRRAGTVSGGQYHDRQRSYWGMSRGLGRIERHVMQFLTEVDRVDPEAYVLLSSLAGQNPAWDDHGRRFKVNDSRMESTRRALRTLDSKGLIERRTVKIYGAATVVARLFRSDRPSGMPKDLDAMLRELMTQTISLQNEFLRKRGARFRINLSDRPYVESGWLADPENPTESFISVYLYHDDYQHRSTWYASGVGADSDEPVAVSASQNTAVESLTTAELKKEMAMLMCRVMLETSFDVALASGAEDLNQREQKRIE